MFDPAIMQNLEAPMPPQPPVTVQEHMWLSPSGTAVQRVAQRLTDQYGAAAEAWIRTLDGVRAQIESITFPVPATAEDLARLDALIEEFEAHADLRATLSARLAKRIRRDVKAMFKADPSVGAVSRVAGDTLIGTDKRIVEALLDYALMLRALRAEGSGEARGGPVFEGGDALRRHLDSLAA